MIPAQTRELRELVTLRPGVYRVSDGGGRLHLASEGDSELLGQYDSTVEDALRGIVNEARPAAELAVPEGMLDRLRAGGWLSTTVAAGDRPLYTIVPYRRPPQPVPERGPGGRPVLSRFALLRRTGDRLVAESPRAWCTIEIHDESVLAALLPGASPTAATAWLGPQLTARLQRDLWWAGFLVGEPDDESTVLQLAQWSPHELWFHDRTRAARRDPDRGFGATWWARGRFEPMPPVRERFDGPATALYRPDPATLRATDPVLTEVLENRRSIRYHDDAAPIDLRQLGEFLHRCCRNRRRRTDDGVEYVSRPYPAGGAMYELEVYPAVRLVAGLGAGLYHYDPEEHQLVLVRGPGRAVDRLVRAAAGAAASPSLPQVALVIAARFGRLMWKYESMAYSLALKDVGVLYQVMYAVATAMGLAPCALGVGAADVFAHATGNDPAVEGSVGEFLLGSRAAREA